VVSGGEWTCSKAVLEKTVDLQATSDPPSSWRRKFNDPFLNTRGNLGKGTTPHVLWFHRGASSVESPFFLVPYLDPFYHWNTAIGSITTIKVESFG
jgi:hypothetical protein